jgi:hypothetical protein
MIAFHMISRVIGTGLVFLAGTVGCDKATSPTSQSATATSATTAAATTTVAAPAKPPPDDLDLAPIDKALACGGKTATGPCRVLDGFKNGKEWSGRAPSGEGRYVGHGYVVAGGKITEEIAIVRTRVIPVDQAPAGQLAVKLAFEKMPDEPAPRRDAAEKAIRAFQRHDVHAKGNTAVSYVNELKDFREVNAMQTKSRRVVALTDELTYIAEASAQSLAILRVKANGDYAEVWPTSW